MSDVTCNFIRQFLRHDRITPLRYYHHAVSAKDENVKKDRKEMPPCVTLIGFNPCYLVAQSVPKVHQNHQNHWFGKSLSSSSSSFFSPQTSQLEAYNYDAARLLVCVSCFVVRTTLLPPVNAAVVMRSVASVCLSCLCFNVWKPWPRTSFLVCRYRYILKIPRLKFVFQGNWVKVTAEKSCIYTSVTKYTHSRVPLRLKGDIV